MIPKDAYQIKFFKNKDGSYSITERIIEVE